MDKKALHQLTYGLYIVGSGTGERINGQIANTVFQVTSAPAAITVCINKENHTHTLIRETGILSVSVLEQDTPMELIGKFGFKTGRELKKFQGLSYQSGLTGAPVLYEHSTAYFEGNVTEHLSIGTHTLFCANVVDCGIIGDGEPLTYAYYHAVKNGKAPKSAPTYLGLAGEEQKDAAAPAKLDGAESKYSCNICGYVYDPRNGDPEAGIAAGTSFDDLPAEWVCPVCAAGKDEFSKED